MNKTFLKAVLDLVIGKKLKQVYIFDDTMVFEAKDAAERYKESKGKGYKVVNKADLEKALKPKTNTKKDNE